MCYKNTLNKYLLLTALFLPFVNILPGEAQEANPTPPTTVEEIQQEDLTSPDNTRPLNQADSILSLEGGQRLMNEANEAINAENYELATSKLQQARQVFNQLTNFYLQLNKSFAGIDNRIAEAQKSSAAQTGQMRDEATYQLALVHRAQSQPELAVPLLIQVIRSQNPTSELGKKSYQQLYEIGFVDTPFPSGQSQ
jgi:thioredoxin-like negative regulator of GroEL